VDLGMIAFIPRGINFSNYIEIFKLQNLGNAAMISVIRTLLATALNLFFTAYMAYFFTKQDMWGRKVWYRLVVITMYFSAGLIPAYLNNRMLGLTNTFWIYIVPGLISVYNLILVKTSIEAMPPDLEESAYLDGAGYMRRFLLIVLPLQKPILATVALFTAVNHWNDFFTTKLYITNTKLYTLQFLLYEMLTQIKAAAEQIVAENPYAAITPTGIRLTLTAVVVIPIMLVYPLIQRYYVKGIMVGAVKG
jgi:multiple sugar transport system permease protein/putative aldouronate transport system permease protein